jgi:hypothetical protein
MSYQGSEWARKVRGVNRGEKAVLMLMGHFQDQRTNVIRVRVSDVQENTEICGRQVRRILQQLESPRLDHPKGIIKQIGGGIGKGNVSLYSFIGFAIAKADISDDQKRTLETPKADILEAKADISDSAIRNIRTSKNCKQIQRQETSSEQTPDDIQINPVEVERILDAFEESPVTSGETKPADRETARRLLQAYSVAQIEYGILLASARVAATGKKVQSLAYFENAVQEAAADGNASEAYAQYLKHVIARATRKPVQAAG